MNYPYYGFQNYTPQDTFRLPYTQQTTASQDERVWGQIGKRQMLI